MPVVTQYNKKVNEQRQSTITRFFKTKQRVANVIENITEEEGPVDPGDLDNEQPENHFEGFNKAVDGFGTSSDRVKAAIARIQDIEGMTQ